MFQFEVFRRMLLEAGYIEGRTLTVEYRFAQGRYDRLPERPFCQGSCFRCRQGMSVDREKYFVRATVRNQ